MSATDDLRRMLDECGVEWEAPIGILSYIKTVWRSGSWEYTAIETSGGEFSVYVEHRSWLTAEQVVDATLGNDGAERSKDGVDDCYLIYNGKKYPAVLNFGFLGLMPITISVGGFRYLVEVPNGE